jgi:hypothetical protein
MFAQYRSLPMREENGKVITLEGEESRRLFLVGLAYIGVDAKWKKDILK